MNTIDTTQLKTICGGTTVSGEGTGSFGGTNASGNFSVDIPSVSSKQLKPTPGNKKPSGTGTGTATATIGLK